MNQYDWIWDSTMPVKLSVPDRMTTESAERTNTDLHSCQELTLYEYSRRGNQAGIGKSWEHGYSEKVSRHQVLDYWHRARPINDQREEEIRRKNLTSHRRKRHIQQNYENERQPYERDNDKYPEDEPDQTSNKFSKAEVLRVCRHLPVSLHWPVVERPVHCRHVCELLAD